MGLPLVDDAVGLLARRCSVPDDLTKVTVRGAEVDSGRQKAATVWALVEDVYRSGMHPGIQVCIRERGEIVVDRAIGHARGHLPNTRFDPHRAVPLTLETPINLFSAAKAVTGVVMHKLEEQGILSLDDAVAEHVPGFERHGKGSITLRHVLSHRAGLAVMPQEAFDLDLLADPDKIEAIICELRPSHIPGAFPQYHAVTGGFVMEAVSRHAAGRSLRDVLETEVRRPLGLDWFHYGVPPADVDQVALNVETGMPLGPVMGLFMKRILGKPWGEVLKMSNDPRFLTAVIPAGNVIVTARDVTAFYQCLLNGGVLDGTRILEEDTIEQTLTAPHDEVVFDRLLGFPLRYGSGFMLGSDSISPFGWNRPRAFGHLGMSNLFTWADPDAGLSVAVLTTGKPVIGPHLPPLVKLIGGITAAFSPAE